MPILRVEFDFKEDFDDFVSWMSESGEQSYEEWRDLRLLPALQVKYFNNSISFEGD